VNNIGKNQVSERDIEDYLSVSKNKRNDLAMLKACFRNFLKVDIVGEFKIPRNNIKPKILPDINKISRFYNTIPNIRDNFVYPLTHKYHLTQKEAKEPLFVLRKNYQQ